MEHGIKHYCNPGQDFWGLTRGPIIAGDQIHGPREPSIALPKANVLLALLSM